ncbi:hypothetical protein V5N11_033065 [Cardamine amara subsp. amara]|uniref:RRM domain-containing protein n=1 Tax=Cardamine amara subsp. amara TaxID=228776 RepID=A0ABD1BNL7_CARAN
MDRRQQTRKRRKTTSRTKQPPIPDPPSSPFRESSSSDSHYFYQECVVSTGKLHPSVTEEDLRAFFRDVANPSVIQFHSAEGQKAAVITFSSNVEAKQALSLKGSLLKEQPLFISPSWTGLRVFCVSGLGSSRSQIVLANFIRTVLEPCGTIMRTFFPKIGESHFGLAYVCVDQSEISFEKAVQQSEEVTGVYPIEDGRIIEIRVVNLKNWVAAALTELDSDAAQQVFADNLKPPPDLTSFQSLQEPLSSWSKDRPDIFLEPYLQVGGECWAVTLFRGYHALMKILSRPHTLTLQQIKDAVAVGHLMDGDGGIDKMRNAIPSMLPYVKNMKVYHRPNKASSEEEFEKFEENIIRLLGKHPVMATIEIVPSYDDFGFDGNEMFLPSVSDLYIRQMEKLPLHSMLLSAHSIHGFQFQDSNGADRGVGGFIWIARHCRLIKHIILYEV